MLKNNGFHNRHSPILRAFSPLSLFSGGAPGAWYDPSDYGATGTLFQDSAGTTPVTAVEQPVGLMLDKSQGLVLGSELVVNGDFSNGTTGWTASSATISASSGELLLTNTGAAYGSFGRTIATVVGKTYSATATMRVETAASTFLIARTTPTSGNIASVEVASTTNTARTFYFTAVGTTTYIVGLNNNTSGGTAYFDNISVKELAGNHAFQATSASRPVLSARYNLLTKTEQFDDGAWVKSGTTVTANFGIAPDGTATADRALTVATGNALKATYQSFSAEAGTYRFNLYVKDNASSSRVFEVFFANTSLSATTGTSYNFDTDSLTNLSNAAPFTLVSSNRTSSGNGWYLISITVAVASAQTVRLYFSAPYAGTQSGDYLVWGADLRVANNGITQPAYQRVNTSTDYNTTGFLPYLKFDGVDDSLSTNSISFTSTDKMSVFAGVRKLSAVTGLVYETSVNNSLNNGSISSFLDGGGNGTNTIDASLKGSATQTYFSCGTFPPPITYVQSVIFDIAGADRITEVIPRINGVLNQTGGGGAANTGTGNFGNYPLYIGRRGGTSNPFNGQLYGLIIVGKAVTAGELSSTETYVNQKTGAY